MSRSWSRSGKKNIFFDVDIVVKSKSNMVKRSVLLSTTICVITVVKMLWTHEAQPGESTTNSTLNVAEHSFQEPIPNSPLLLSYSCFGARFLQESTLTTEKFILAFWLRCVLLPWQRGWLKARLKKWFLSI